MKDLPGDFEMIMITGDRDKESMLKYMVKNNMTWPTIKFEETGKSKIRSHYSSGYLPNLVIIDDDGNVISNKRNEAMAVLREKLQEAKEAKEAPKK